MTDTEPNLRPEIGTSPSALDVAPVHELKAPQKRLLRGSEEILARSLEVIELLNSSCWDLNYEDLGFSAIFESAQDKKKLNQLHSLYSEIKPVGSKLKDGCHWSNLKASFTEDTLKDPSLETKLSALYANYIAHFGKKHILVEEISSSTLKTDLLKFDFSQDFGWTMDSSSLINNEAPEATTSPLRVVATNKSATGTMSFLIREEVESFYYGTPDTGLLSAAGIQLQSNMRLKKRVVVTGFHKVIINPAFDLRIILVDPGTLIGTETATDKAVATVNVIRSVLTEPSKHEESKHRLAFFPAIKKLYEDKTVGRVVGGYFYTSTGARYIHNSKGTGSDLRKDPFQQGGEQAVREALNFIKIDVEWADVKGRPCISLNGSAEMFELPEHSLHAMEVLFSTAKGEAANFLDKPLSYGLWK